MSSSLEIKEEGLVARLTLNRPDCLNALDWGLAGEFRGAVSRLSRSRARVVILSGAGRAFCAGGDLGFIEGNRRLPVKTLVPRMRRFYGSFLALRDVPQITIAQINGPAIGAGLCLALACDLRTVLTGARLAINFSRLGLAAGMGAWPLAKAALGDSRARELLMTGRDFTGAELHRWGAASLSCRSLRELERRTARLASAAASGSRQMLRALRAEIRLGEPLGEWLSYEARTQAASFKAPDLAEGLAALKERRPPRF